MDAGTSRNYQFKVLSALILVILISTTAVKNAFTPSCLLYESLAKTIIAQNELKEIYGQVQSEAAR